MWDAVDLEDIGIDFVGEVSSSKLEVLAGSTMLFLELSRSALSLKAELTEMF